MANPQVDQEHSWHCVGQNTFGSFLKRERGRHGLSRHSLAIITGIQERRLEAMELNQAPPGYQNIKNLAVVLEIPERELLEAAGYVKPNDGA